MTKPIGDHLNLDDITSADLDPSVRRQLDEACRALPFDARVMPVKAFRDDIRVVRQKTSNGAIVVVSDRAGVRDAADTTVVLSLKTLHETLVDVIQKAFEAAKRRGRPADLLMGLQSPALSTSAVSLDFDGLAKAEAAEGVELRFVRDAPVPAVNPVAR
ncbi:MAG: hypothetical protein ABI665_05510 [Vicinamibacterales bacterium]